jgi:hypothetical protein
MPTPDPEKFAKIVLWRLASLQAEVSELKLRMIELKALQENKGAVDGETNEWEQRWQALRKRLYREDIQKVGLPFDAIDDPTKN